MSSRPTARIGMLAAAVVIVGIVISGPLAVALVEATHPQPAWSSPEVLVEHFHPIQVVPYPGGIVLVGGLVLLMASLHALARPAHRAWANAALVLTAVFAAMIFLNYVVQSAFVPALVRDYDPRNASLLAAVSMVNPRSLTWAIEMWGWGFFGVATAVVAVVFDGDGVERAARTSFVLNAPVSVIGALATTLWPGWPMTTAGLVSFASWNVLLLAMAALAGLALRARVDRKEASCSSPDVARSPSPSSLPERA